jgi:hypothetical protein
MSVKESLWGAAIVLGYAMALILMEAACSTRRIESHGRSHVAATLKLKSSKQA